MYRYSTLLPKMTLVIIDIRYRYSYKVLYSVQSLGTASLLGRFFLYQVPYTVPVRYRYLCTQVISQVHSVRWPKQKLAQILIYWYISEKLLSCEKVGILGRQVEPRLEYHSEAGVVKLTNFTNHIINFKSFKMFQQF